MIPERLHILFIGNDGTTTRKTDASTGIVQIGKGFIHGFKSMTSRTSSTHGAGCCSSSTHHVVVVCMHGTRIVSTPTRAIGLLWIGCMMRTHAFVFKKGMFDIEDCSIGTFGNELFANDTNISWCGWQTGGMVGDPMMCRCRGCRGCDGSTHVAAVAGGFGEGWSKAKFATHINLGMTGGTGKAFRMIQSILGS